MGLLAVPCIRTPQPPGGWIFAFVIDPDNLSLFAHVKGVAKTPEILDNRRMELLPALRADPGMSSGFLLVGFLQKLDFQLQARINRGHSVGMLRLTTGRRRTGWLVGDAEGIQTYRSARQSGGTVSIVAFEADSQSGGSAPSEEGEANP